MRSKSPRSTRSAVIESSLIEDRADPVTWRCKLFSSKEDKGWDDHSVGKGKEQNVWFQERTPLANLDMTDYQCNRRRVHTRLGDQIVFK
jgi:hypothetical protein